MIHLSCDDNVDVLLQKLNINISILEHFFYTLLKLNPSIKKVYTHHINIKSYDDYTDFCFNPKNNIVIPITKNNKKWYISGIIHEFHHWTQYHYLKSDWKEVVNYYKKNQDFNWEKYNNNPHENACRQMETLYTQYLSYEKLYLKIQEKIPKL